MPKQESTLILPSYLYGKRNEIKFCASCSWTTPLSYIIVTTWKPNFKTQTCIYRDVIYHIPKNVGMLYSAENKRTVDLKNLQLLGNEPLSHDQQACVTYLTMISELGEILLHCYCSICSVASVSHYSIITCNGSLNVGLSQAMLQLEVLPRSTRISHETNSS